MLDKKEEVVELRMNETFWVVPNHPDAILSLERDVSCPSCNHVSDRIVFGVHADLRLYQCFHCMRTYIPQVRDGEPVWVGFSPQEDFRVLRATSDVTLVLPPSTEVALGTVKSSGKEKEEFRLMTERRKLGLCVLCGTATPTAGRFVCGSCDLVMEVNSG